MIITISVILLFLALGLGIFAHAKYTINDGVDDVVKGYATAAIISFAAAMFTLIRVTREKPIDLTDTTTTSLRAAASGIMTAGLGAVALLFAAPQLHILLSREIARPGSGIAIDDFPVQTARPALHWLVDNMGAFGVSLPLGVIGAGLIVLGLRRLRARKTIH